MTTKTATLVVANSFVLAFVRQTKELVDAVKAGKEGAYDALLRRAEQAHTELGSEFVEENIQTLLDEADKAILAQEAEKVAVEAEVTKQAAEAPKVQKTEGEKRVWRRARLAEILRTNEHDEAAKAVESDIESLNGKQSSQYAKDIRLALKDGGAKLGKEDWSKVGWAIYYQAKARADACSEDSVLFFIEPIIRVFLVLTAAEKVSEGILKGAEKTLSLAKPANEWSFWALGAIDRLISSKEENPINVLPFARHYKADALITRLLGDVRDAINTHREAIRQNKAVGETARRARQLERAQASCKKGVGTGNKKGKKPGKK